MNRFLQDALVALGWTEARQQNAFFSLLKRVVGQDAESVVFLSASDALEWVKHKTQESFLRAAGSERDACLYVGADAERIARENRGDLLALELIHSLFPPAQYYDAVLLMGASEKAVEKRVKFMNELPARGTSAEAVYLLGTTGEMTEFPMMENVMQREGKAWKDTPAIAIMTEPPGGKRRANTSDTVGAWCDYLIENNQSPGQVLVVSSQPHVAYQQAIVEQVLQSRFPADRWLVESCGPGVVYDASRVAESLDAIARYIYAFFP